MLCSNYKKHYPIEVSRMYEFARYKHIIPPSWTINMWATYAKKKLRRTIEVIPLSTSSIPPVKVCLNIPEDVDSVCKKNKWDSIKTITGKDIKTLSPIEIEKNYFYVNNIQDDIDGIFHMKNNEVIKSFYDNFINKVFVIISSNIANLIGKYDNLGMKKFINDNGYIEFIKNTTSLLLENKNFFSILSYPKFAKKVSSIEEFIESYLGEPSNVKEIKLKIIDNIMNTIGVIIPKILLENKNYCMLILKKHTNSSVAINELFEFWMKQLYSILHRKSTDTTMLLSKYFTQLNNNYINYWNGTDIQEVVRDEIYIDPNDPFLGIGININNQIKKDPILINQKTVISDETKETTEMTEMTEKKEIKEMTEKKETKETEKKNVITYDEQLNNLEKIISNPKEIENIDALKIEAPKNVLQMNAIEQIVNDPKQIMNIDSKSTVLHNKVIEIKKEIRELYPVYKLELDDVGDARISHNIGHHWWREYGYFELNILDEVTALKKMYELAGMKYKIHKDQKFVLIIFGVNKEDTIAKVANDEKSLINYFRKLNNYPHRDDLPALEDIPIGCKHTLTGLHDIYHHFLINFRDYKNIKFVFYNTKK